MQDEKGPVYSPFLYLVFRVNTVQESIVSGLEEREMLMWHWIAALQNIPAPVKVSCPSMLQRDSMHDDDDDASFS